MSSIANRTQAVKYRNTCRSAGTAIACPTYRCFSKFNFTVFGTNTSSSIEKATDQRIALHGRPQEVPFNGHTSLRMSYTKALNETIHTLRFIHISDSQINFGERFPSHHIIACTTIDYPYINCSSSIKV